MSVNGALVEDKMCRFKGEWAHFSFKKCPIYTHDGASTKFSTNSHETDYSVPNPTPSTSVQRLSADYTQRQNNNFDSFLWDNGDISPGGV